MQDELESGYCSSCFGSKKLLKQRWNVEDAASPFANVEAWRKEWRTRRSHRLFFLGSEDETQGNQLLQLKHKGVGYFEIKMLSPYQNDRSFLTGLIRIPYMYEELERTVEKKSATYTLIKKKKGWYIQPMVSQAPRRPRCTMGCLALDINNGFISVARLNAAGEFEEAEDLKYEDISSCQRSAVEQIIAHVFTAARREDRSVAIEDISLTKKKNAIQKGRSKKYNRMLSGFPYLQYRELCERASLRYGVHLYIVNPAYTSVIGREKYMNQLKLPSVHQSAACVIGRRALGFREIYKKTPSQKEGSVETAQS